VSNEDDSRKVTLALELQAGGSSLHQIAKQLGVSKSVVYRWSHEAKQARRQPHEAGQTAARDFNIERLWQLYLRTKPGAESARLSGDLLTLHRRGSRPPMKKEEQTVEEICNTAADSDAAALDTVRVHG
jgi:flagellar motor protein MotB